MKNFKVLQSGIDFTSAFSVRDLMVGDEVIMKSMAVSGWARTGKVTRVMNTQIEVECTNVIPTKDRCNFGTVNPFVDSRFKGGFFENWAWFRKTAIGRKSKFFRADGIEVGSRNEWNPRGLAVII
jgi:hypothetical protein